MGVKGLWRLLMPIGRRISIETLEGKILAVDASIWLTQFLKAMRDPDSGKVRPAAHLIGFFRRLCKLRYQGIRPVFVFDGATPEIKQRELRDRRKRREQFSHEHSEDAVQRMAKRLLVHQLKKKGGKISGAVLKRKQEDIEGASATDKIASDTITATGAYAPGFYDPEMDSAGSKITGVVTTLDDTKPFEDSPIDPDLVEILDDPTDYLDQATSRVNNQSDWDTIVIEAETLQQSSEKGPKQEGGQPTSATDIRDYASADPNDFDVEFVASLPATSRKDVVEDAQKKRRLQSRREFMKVAYDPEGLSKCQLRNFLKSSKLNQNIHKMAQRASKASGFGDAIASDRTKRIIFETDAGIDDAARKKANKELELSKLRQKRELSVMSSSEEESDEGIEWQDETDVIDIFGGGGKRRAVVDEDDEESESDAEGFHGSGFFTSSGASISTRIPLRNGKDTETFSDQEISNGGFMKKTRTKNSNPLIVSSSKRKTTIVIQDSDSSDEQKPPSRHTGKGDDKTKEQFNDEALARALQEAEYESDEEEGSFFSIAAHASQSSRLQTEANISGQQSRSLSSRRITPSIPTSARSSVYQSEYNSEGDGDVEEVEGTLLIRPRTQTPTDQSTGHLRQNPLPQEQRFEVQKTGKAECVEGLCIHDDSDDEDIVWQDGDCDVQVVDVHCATEGRHVMLSQLQSLPTEDKTIHTKNSKAQPLPDQHQTSALQSNLSSLLNPESTEVSTKRVKSDDESIEWEDGDYSEKTAFPEKSMQVQKNVTASQLAEAKRDPCFDNDHGDEIAYPEDEQKSDHGEDVFQDSWPEDIDNDVEKRSKEMSAALEQAQTTAANLTNWAGRAFRRAVAQHAAETGLNIPQNVNPKVIPACDNNGGSSSVAREEVVQEHSVHATQLRSKKVDTIDHVTQESKVTNDSDTRETKEGQTSSVAWPEVLGDETVLRTLEEYQEKWAHERNQQDRDADTMTDEMKAEAMNLLQLFGVPYVEAPAEAEAQCVMLEALGLVDGIVTEDSDAFVFGGKRIYKNIFDDQRYVEVYDARDAEEEMNLTRDGIVALAMLLGGDYTEGVKGVGIVNGMEIVQAFDVSSNLKAGLEKFRRWLDGFNPFDSLNVAQGEVEMTTEHIFHRKHHSARTRWVAPKYFPDPKVLAAYLNPVVDTSEERFSWGIPDMDRLILFCNKHVGWTADETRKLLKPVVDKIESGGSMYQTRVDSFMRYEDGIKFANVRSKRLRDVLSSVKETSGGQNVKSEVKKKKIHEESSTS